MGSLRACAHRCSQCGGVCEKYAGHEERERLARKDGHCYVFGHICKACMDSTFIAATRTPTQGAIYGEFVRAGLA